MYYQRWGKRLLDLVIASIMCMFFLPAHLLIIFAIKILDPGPVFFKQKRVGKNKQYFNMVKYRSMKVDAPREMPTHQLKNPDQYITKLGSFLRRTSLDELPQLFHVVKGDMSLVGPRPALWNQFDLIEERDKYSANVVVPGITGWAQINGRDELSIPEKAKQDGYYVAHISLWMDLKCLAGTVCSVLRREGVQEGDREMVSDDLKIREGFPPDEKVNK